jgi:putative transcriptional regulator
MRKTKSRILEAVQETARGLHEAGVMDQVTLPEFDR